MRLHSCGSSCLARPASTRRRRRRPCRKARSIRAPPARPAAGRNAPTVGKDSERTLSDQLAQSKGVICPPAGVDPQMRQPPPEGGAMRVIPPPGSPGGNPNASSRNSGSLSCARARPISATMRKLLILVPLVALLAASVWFAIYSWTAIEGPPVPAEGHGGDGPRHRVFADRRLRPDGAGVLLEPPRLRRRGEPRIDATSAASR